MNLVMANDGLKTITGSRTDQLIGSKVIGTWPGSNASDLCFDAATGSMAASFSATHCVFPDAEW